MLKALAAFLSGFITLSLEILGFRALAPYFGYSIYVFGSLIGIVLLAMALGYILGGQIGGRWSSKNFALLLLFGSGYVGLAAITYPAILGSLADLPLLPGALIGTLIVFAVPQVVFASVSPYLVALFHENGLTPAKASGRVSFATTVGGLAGVFLTSFLLLPLMGTRGVFILNALLGVLVVLAFERRLAIFGIAFLFIPFAPISKDRHALHEEDSLYSHLEVVDYGGFIGLRTEKRSGTVYSVVPKSGNWRYSGGLYDFFSVAPLFAPGNEALIMGLGAGTLPLIHEGANPDLRITGVEIDPAVVDIGKKYFGLTNRRNIASVEIGDVRPFLFKDSRRYDLIEIDLFRGGVEIPFYLVTKEFFGLTKQRLNAGGIVAMNIYDVSETLELRDAVLSTMAESFPYIHVVAVGRGSFFVVGSMDQLADLDLRGIKSEDLRKVAMSFQKEKFRFEPKKELVLTDNKAPLERFYGSPF